MHIHFQRTGGFAGMVLSHEVETETLPNDDARELKSKFDAADFFSLPEQIRASSEGVDRFQYQITVKTSQKTHSISVDESAIPDSLQPLIRQLTSLARSGS